MIVRWIAAPVATMVLVGSICQPAQAATMAPREQAASSAAVAGVGAAAEPAALHGLITPGLSPRGDLVLPKGPSWWRILSRRGTSPDVTTVTRGKHAHEWLAQLVIGKRYRVQGRLPTSHRGALAGENLAIEARPDTGGPWKSVARFTSDNHGRFVVGIRIPETLHGVNDFRIKATSNARSARQATILPGGTLTAVADIAFSLTIANNTKTDLVLSFPTWKDPATGLYGNGIVAVPQGASQVLTFINPIEDATAVGFSVQRLECTFGCATYYANWDHTPSKKHTPCSTGMPTFDSGSAHTVRLTPQLLTSGFDMFMLDGNGAEICTGSLDTKFSQWFGNHPVVKWIAIAAVAAVVVYVAWEGIAAVSEALAADEVLTFSESVIQGEDFFDFERFPLVFPPPIE